MCSSAAEKTIRLNGIEMDLGGCHPKRKRAAGNPGARLEISGCRSAYFAFTAAAAAATALRINSARLLRK